MSPSGPSAVNRLFFHRPNEAGMQKSSLQKVKCEFSETTGSKVAAHSANTNDPGLGSFL